MTLTQAALVVFSLGTAAVGGQTCTESDVVVCSSNEATGLCSEIHTLVDCLSGVDKDNSCRLRETNGVTIEQVKQIATDYCPAILPITEGYCEELHDCVMYGGKYYVAMVNGIYDDYDRTDYWCRLFSEMLGCALHTADSCDVDANTFSALGEAVRHIDAICPDGAGTIQVDTLAMALLFSAAALLQQLISA